MVRSVGDLGPDRQRNADAEAAADKLRQRVDAEAKRMIEAFGWEVFPDIFGPTGGRLVARSHPPRYLGGGVRSEPVVIRAGDYEDLRDQVIAQITQTAHETLGGTKA